MSLLWIILVVFLILVVVGALPHWGYMSGYNYGYAPSGAIGLIVVVILVLFLLGRL